jgi:hypothetical protein
VSPMPEYRLRHIEMRDLNMAFLVLVSTRIVCRAWKLLASGCETRVVETHGDDFQHNKLLPLQL